MTTTTKTEFDFGAEYANSLPEAERKPVDVAAMATSTNDIPSGDYDAMVAAGIDCPDARKYWRGFNSRCED